MRITVKFMHGIYMFFYASTCFSSFVSSYMYVRKSSHIPCKDMYRLGIMLGCWPGERKHRLATIWARLSYGPQFEQQVTYSMVNSVCTSYEEEAVPLAEASLVNPVRMESLQIPLQRSAIAILPCGHVNRGDLVFLVDGTVAEVLAFVSDEHATSVSVMCCSFRCIGNDEWTREGQEQFLPFHSVVSVVMWVLKRTGVIWVLKPVKLVGV
jgi:hypothetical protein